MPDYGRALQFGVFITPSADLLDNSYALADLADESLNIIAIQDHPYQRRFLDAWAFMSTLLARTSRVRMIPGFVANVPLRNPAVMAKTAASLDVLSSGRMELALALARCGTRSWRWAGRGTHRNRQPRRYGKRSM